MDFRKVFLLDLHALLLMLLGIAYVSAKSTSAPTQGLDIYNEKFDDLLPLIPLENRKWWLNKVQLGDVKDIQPYTAKQKAKKVNIINNARANTKTAAARMRKMVWNDQLEAALVAYRNNNNGSIFYSLKHHYPKTIPEVKVNLFGAHLMQEPEFAEFWPNCDYWWHDTNNPGAEDRIFTMRSNIQVPCFNYRLCNTTAYNNFFSCIIDPQYDPEAVCAFANRYYGNIVREELESFAFIQLLIPGPWTPHRQLYAFWGYACTSTPKKHINDIPYKSGPRASECPPTFPLATGGLCTAKPSTPTVPTVAPIKQPSFSPTGKPFTTKPTKNPTKNPTKSNRRGLTMGA